MFTQVVGNPPNLTMPRVCVVLDSKDASPVLRSFSSCFKIVETGYLYLITNRTCERQSLLFCARRHCSSSSRVGVLISSRTCTQFLGGTTQKCSNMAEQSRSLLAFEAYVYIRCYAKQFVSSSISSAFTIPFPLQLLYLPLHMRSL